MGKQSQFELGTRKKLRDLQAEWNELEVERASVVGRQKMIEGKQAVLEELFDYSNGQGGDSANPED